MPLFLIRRAQTFLRQNSKRSAVRGGPVAGDTVADDFITGDFVTGSFCILSYGGGRDNAFDTSSLLAAISARKRQTPPEKIGRVDQKRRGGYKRRELRQQRGASTPAAWLRYAAARPHSAEQPRYTAALTQNDTEKDSGRSRCLFVAFAYAICIFAVYIRFSTGTWSNPDSRASGSTPRWAWSRARTHGCWWLPGCPGSTRRWCPCCPAT